MNGVLLRGFLALSATAVTLVVIELSLPAFVDDPEIAAESWRVRGLHQPDSELLYSLRPNFKRTWRTEEFVEDVSTNSWGLRGAEIDEDEPRRPRILVLGDSMTFGHGVGDRQTFSSQLESMLERSSDGVEVINAGTKGYGTDHSFRLFKMRLHELDPDLVILAINSNDTGDNVTHPLYGLDGQELVELDPTQHPLYRQGRLHESVPDLLSQTNIGRLIISTVSGIRNYDPRQHSGDIDPLAGRH